MSTIKPTTTNRQSIAVVLELLALLSVALFRRIGFSGQVDIHVADEIMYLNRGRRILDGDLSAVDLAYSPPYCLGYGLLDLFPTEPGTASDWMYWLTGLASAVALWWALRRLASGAIACLAGCWWVASPALLQLAQIGFGSTPHVYAFAACFVFLSFGCLVRGRTILGLLAFLVAATTRTEFAPWLLLFGLLLAWLGTPRWRSWPALAALACGALLSALVLSHAELRVRSWQAFSQHYARAAVTADLQQEFGDAGPRNPDEAEQAATRLYASWNASEQRMAEDFPGASSPFAALRANPGRFAWHLGHNLLATPMAFLRGADTRLVPSGMTPWVAAVLAAIALWSLLRWRRDLPTHSLPPPARAFLWSMLGILPSVLLVAPRTDLLYPTLLTLFVPTALGLCRVPSLLRLGPIGNSSAVATILVVLALLGPRPFDLPARSDLEHRDALQLLQRELPPQRVGLLTPAATAYASILGRDRIRPIDLRLRALPADVAAWVTEQQPDFILLSGNLRNMARALPDLRLPTESPDWRLRARLHQVELYEFAPQ